MFVYNFKVNKIGIFKIFMFVFAIIIISIIFATAFNILKNCCSIHLYNYDY